MWAVFKKAFRDSRKTVFWLCIGLGLYAIFIISFYPAIVEQTESLDKMMDALPKEMISLFYGGDAEDINLFSPANYLQSQFTLWMELILASIIIAQAFNAITNAERDGTLDVLLSLPVSRRQMLLARFANTAAGTLIILTVVFVALWVSAILWPEFDVPPLDLALGIYGMFFPLMVVTGLAYLLASVVPSSKHFAGAIVYLVVFGSYLLYSLAGVAEALQKIKPVLLFHYYSAATIIDQGVDASDWVLLGAVALLYMALAWWRIDYKELGV